MTELPPMRENAQGRWVEQGNGAPVILLHGIPTSPRLWRHVMPLVQGHCLAWRLAAELGCELIRIPNGKHFTPEDHPETIASAVNSLLSAA